MATIGWLIVSPRSIGAFAASSFEILSFHRSGDEPFKIQTPLITPMEIGALERSLPSVDAAEVGWIPEKERQAFATAYRYLPHFGILEPL